MKLYDQNIWGNFGVNDAVGNRKYLVNEMVREQDADICCFQECNPGTMRAGKRPFVIGKPSPLMIQLAMEKEKCTPQETAVIGDRIYTDIKSGLNAGALSVLVMSGETTSEILNSSGDKPDIVLKNAGEIVCSKGNI